MLLSLENIVVRWEQSLERSGADRFPFWSSETRNTFATVLNNLSLQVEIGDFLVVLGPSGSGKTTLLKTIAGLIQPESGSILFRGNDVSRLVPHQRELSLVLQNGGWYDHLTVEKNLDLDGAKEQAVSDTLERFGLSDFRRRLPSQLSGGQTQRLAIARAWLRKHELILFDEPLSQLDYCAKESLREVIKQLHRAGKTLIYVTHDQYDAQMLATKIAVLHDGRIQQCDTPENIYRQPNHRSVAEALGQPPMQFFDVSNSTAFETVFRLRFGATSDPSNAQVGIRPDAWTIVDPAISDTFPGSIRLRAVLSERRVIGSQRLETWSSESPPCRSLRINRLSSSHERPSVLEGTAILEAKPEDVHFYAKESGSLL